MYHVTDHERCVRQGKEWEPKGNAILCMTLLYIGRQKREDQFNATLYQPENDRNTPTGIKLVSKIIDKAVST